MSCDRLLSLSRSPSFSCECQSEPKQHCGGSSRTCSGVVAASYCASTQAGSWPLIMPWFHCCGFSHAGNAGDTITLAAAQAYQAEFVAKEEAIHALNKEVEELQNALQQEARALVQKPTVHTRIWHHEDGQSRLIYARNLRAPLANNQPLRHGKRILCASECVLNPGSSHGRCLRYAKAPARRYGSCRRRSRRLWPTCRRVHPPCKRKHCPFGMAHKCHLTPP